MILTAVGLLIAVWAAAVARLEPAPARQTCRLWVARSPPCLRTQTIFKSYDNSYQFKRFFNWFFMIFMVSASSFILILFFVNFWKLFWGQSWIENRDGSLLIFCSQFCRRGTQLSSSSQRCRLALKSAGTLCTLECIRTKLFKKCYLFEK